MSAFKRRNRWVAKYVRNGVQVWVPGGPWKTKREASDAETAHRGTTPADGITCRVWADRWLTEFPRRSPATRTNYQRTATKFADKFDDRPLASITRLEARSWALTIPKQDATILGAMYADARNMGLVEHNPFHGLRLPAGDKRRDLHIPTMAELDQLVAGCSTFGDAYTIEFAAMIRFAAWTGVRQGELFALHWEDVDTDSERLQVRHSRRQDGSLGPPKNGLQRTVPLLPPVLEALTDADRSRRPDGLVFHAMRGGPLTKANHGYPWGRVRAKAGLEEVRWHDLRHFAASRLLDLGLSPYDVSLFLGHTDGGTLVVERYGHPDESRVRRRIRAAYDLGAGDLLPAAENDSSESGSREVA